MLSRPLEKVTVTCTVTEDIMSKQKEWPVEIIRSNRRRKTVSAALRDDVLVVRVPAKMSDVELRPIIADFQKRMAKRHLPHTDAELVQLAKEMESVFNGRFQNGRLPPYTIRYVTNQNKRFGSCTPAQGTIRISHRVASMPHFVRAYVVVHELAHLLEANHGHRFWQLVNAYPLTERARGYLMAVGLEELGSG